MSKKRKSPARSSVRPSPAAAAAGQDQSPQREPHPGPDPAPQAHGPEHSHGHACGCGHDHQEHGHGHGHPPAPVRVHFPEGHRPGRAPEASAGPVPAGGAAAAAAAVHEHGGEGEFTRRFLLFLEMAVLLLWSVAMIWFYTSGRIDKYLVGDGTFRIQVLIAGLALAVMGWFNWSMRALNAGCGHDHSHDGDSGGAGGSGEGCCGGTHDHGHAHARTAHQSCCGHDHGHTHDHAARVTKGASCSGHDHVHGDDCGHDHSHAHSDEADPGGGHSHSAHSHEGTVSGRGMGLLLLALSVSAAVALTPDDFSDTYKKNMLHAYASQPAAEKAMPAAYRVTPEPSADGAGGGGLTLAQIEKVQPRNKDGNFEMDVMQLYYSGSDPEYARVMKGQAVETVGQIVKDTADPAPNRWRVFVLQVTCCAADARPYSVPVEFTGAVPPDLQEMGWYRLTGKLDYTMEKNAGVSVLHALTAQPTLRPRDQRSLF